MSYSLSAITDLFKSDQIDNDDLFLISDKASDNKFYSRYITYQQLKDKLSTDLTGDGGGGEPISYDNKWIANTISSGTATTTEDCAVMLPYNTTIYIDRSYATSKKGVEFSSQEKIDIGKILPTLYTYRRVDYCILEVEKGQKFQLRPTRTIFGTYDTTSYGSIEFSAENIIAERNTNTGAEKKTTKIIEYNDTFKNAGIKRIQCSTVATIYRNTCRGDVDIYIQNDKEFIVTVDYLKITNNTNGTSKIFTNIRDLKKRGYTASIDGVTCRRYTLTYAPNDHAYDTLCYSFEGKLSFSLVTFPVDVQKKIQF